MRLYYLTLSNSAIVAPTLPISLSFAAISECAM